MRIKICGVLSLVLLIFYVKKKNPQYPPRSPQNETKNQNGVIRIIVYSDYWSLK